MLLRRVTEHVKAQNWTAVALDFAIVVIGVFVGLQVNNWNEVRKDIIDERIFLARLHGDIELAEDLSARVRQRRLTRLGFAVDASNVLFAREDREHVSDDECRAIGGSHYFNINLASLSSFSELAGSGRISIISDDKLRSDLVELQQINDSTATLMTLQAAGAHALPFEFPELIREVSYSDAELGEIQTRYSCDLQAMRTNQKFLNAFSQNLDRYDGYIRDGLAPWSDKLQEIHARIDEQLGVDHEGDGSA